MDSRKLAMLHLAYALIPKIDCKRLCTGYCGCIGMEVGEAEEMTKAAGGVEPAVDKLLRCNYLDSNGNCKVYNARPLICRIWGVVENLRCEYGCKAERILTVDQMLFIANMVRMIAGDGENTAINCTDEQWQIDLFQRSHDKKYDGGTDEHTL